MSDLHDLPIEDNDWWACSQAERPLDEHEIYDERCPKCLIKAEADRRAVGGHLELFDASIPPGQRPVFATLAELADGKLSPPI